MADDGGSSAAGAAAGRPATQSPPLGRLAPAVTAAGLYTVAAVLWVALGDVLPGGRWLAVHLFTAGVVTNMVVALTQHFAQTLLHAPERTGRPVRFVLLNTGAVLLLVGLPGGMRVVFVTGATVLTAAVLWLYWDLRVVRRSVLGGRFGFVVRGYERACGAFVHGAILGGLMGAGVLAGTWYGAARVAHLHVNVLGWGGLTLLATVVFFGPTVMRTRMEEGADATAARAIRYGATGLTAGTVALLLTGAGGQLALPARLLGAVGLAVYAAGATAVCLPVWRAGGRARPSPYAWLMRAAVGWFVVAAWLDVGVVATGWYRLLDALGALFLLGVLGQGILAALGYLTPMVTGRGPAGRAAARARLDVLPRTRALAFNAGVALTVGAAGVGTAAGPAGAVVARAGWLLVAGVVVGQLALMASTGRLQLLRVRADRSGGGAVDPGESDHLAR